MSVSLGNLVKLLLLFIVTAISNSFADNSALFTIEFLPAVPTPLGKFDRAMRWMDMNDFGQVTGHAWGSTGGAQAGFLYTPGQGMKYIHLDHCWLNRGGSIIKDKL
jgi:hypothetical protein